MTVSLIERKGEGSTTVFCVTMGLCLVTSGWINWIYLIDGSLTTMTQAWSACLQMIVIFEDVWGHWGLYRHLTKVRTQCQPGSNRTLVVNSVVLGTALVKGWECKHEADASATVPWMRVLYRALCLKQLNPWINMKLSLQEHCYF